tara:strand:- start:1337 stop:3109 length:1773 start_codon:yes stop_codon:yes gene_type:complete
MCGFLGIISKSDFNIKILDEPNNHIVCRGPDNTQKLEFSSNSFFCSLVFNRLSILDLSENANQPMTSLLTKSNVMFNGEIYNHQELRKNLQSNGVRFQTSHSDTEVILHGLDLEGIEFINKLRGQFSIYYFDNRNKKHYLIRDRVGQKPLYYAKNNQSIVFGSNLSAVKELSESGTLDYQQINNYIKYGIVGGKNTLYKNIYKVLPAEIIEITISNKIDLSSEKYWDISTKVDDLKFEEDEFFSVFSESVDIRLNADVPVANFLSGGLDSTSIVKNMFENNNSINTFTVGTDSTKYDESNWAKKVSEKYNTNHQTVTIPSNLNIDFVDKIINSMDEPYADPSIVPSYMISNEISSYYKVAISGDGGDELLGGYERTKLSLNKTNYFKEYFSKIYDIYPSFLGTGANFLSKSNELSVRYKSFLEDKNFLKLLKINSQDTDNYVNIINEIDDYKSLLLADYQFFLPDMMLFKIDRMSMANSLEVRSPFVDHKLVEYILSHNTSYRKDNENKELLKKYLLQDFNQEFVYRKKQGFVFDLESWIYNNLDYFYDYILSSTKLKVLDLSSLKLLRFNKSRVNSQRIWKLYVLEKFI